MAGRAMSIEPSVMSLPQGPAAHKHRQHYRDRHMWQRRGKGAPWTLPALPTSEISPFDQPVATAPSSAVLRVSSSRTVSPLLPITCRFEKAQLSSASAWSMPERKSMVKVPEQSTTTTFSARQTWFACCPPYLQRPVGSGDWNGQGLSKLYVVCGVRCAVCAVRCVLCYTVSKNAR